MRPGTRRKPAMKRLIAAAGLALLAVASTAACGGANTSSPSTVTVTAAPPTQASAAPTVTPPQAAQPPAEMGQWVTDDWLSVNVTFATPTTNPPMVTVTIENTGSVPQTFVAANQWLQDKSGRLFAPDHAWYCDGSHDPDNSSVTSIDLNPGVVVPEICIEFKVPNQPDRDQYMYMLVVHAASPDWPGPMIGLHNGFASTAAGPRPAHPGADRVAPKAWEEFSTLPPTRDPRRDRTTAGVLRFCVRNAALSGLLTDEREWPGVDRMAC